MADPASCANPDRDIQQALTALKRGTQLIKYSRKGKPKFCPFRVSPGIGVSDLELEMSDETSLIWLSHGEERNLKLSSVSRIIPGQRTAVFRRYLRPEKDYLSFSLLYNNGERSLDLICKDKVEAEVWLAGLKTLIFPGQTRGRRTCSDISDLQDGCSDFIANERPFGTTLEFTSSIRNRAFIDLHSHETPPIPRSSDAGLERSKMQVRTSTDGFRLSVSSTPSCSSQGSGPDDIESLGDVYVWGEVWSDGSSSSLIPSKIDVLTPKPLESNVVLDVHRISCGTRHVALVTRQGELFTWGEESGGRLGHGVEKDFSTPRLVEFLAVTNVDHISCGEYHTCAVSGSGDLYTWGDGAYNAGLLGHGSDVSHWIPKRVLGPLEGLHVVSISCGALHSALSTSNGKMFTFGDGTFGVLGHGNRDNALFPREVMSLSGLKTIKVSCGVWHMAAIVEVSNPSASVPSRKLFTWGDGDKYRLGHGDKLPHLIPTIVSSLIDYNFSQLACAHGITVGLTTSGHVFTMGSSEFGQLGNPQSDGKLPCLVQDKLVGEFVEEIACGSYHVAVLTSRTEVFTWGRGANGRLGHGDTEDRNCPTLVEALKDRHVKHLACGSNYTSTICLHKWVSGTDQSVCYSCRQPFGFTRKRHNCYNCGLVHCHACSSRKALRAALAPTPGKPHRVCDSCYVKLKKAAESINVSNFSRKTTSSSSYSPHPVDGREARVSRILLSSTIEPIKYLEVKSIRPGPQPGPGPTNRSDSYSAVRASQVPSLLQLKDIGFPSSLSVLQNALKPVMTAIPPPQTQSQPNSRPSSPYARRPSPPRPTTPVFSRGVIDSLKKTNEFLNQEVNNLQNQVKSLWQKSEAQEEELKKLQKIALDASLLADEKSSTCSAAMEVVMSLTAQLQEMAEKFSPEISSETLEAMHNKVDYFLNTSGNRASENHFSVSSDPVEPSDRTSLDHVDDIETSVRGRGASSSKNSDRRKIIMEQFEPGVYVMFLQWANGTKVFRQVKFSKKRFDSQQAEKWWKENKERVHSKYGQSNSQSNASDSAIDPTPSDENDESAPPS